MTNYARLPFALPDIGDAEIDAVVTALKSGWLSSGPQVIEFERRFADFLGAAEAVSVNSATAGLHLALEALGIGPGDEVLVPTWTFTATAEVVRYLGADPVLCDVDERSLNLDLADAESRITDRTKAVMPVHFAGQPVSPSSLRDFSRHHGLHVVEDAAHALPASAEGELVGSGQSAAAVFSFYATKTMTTGEGGMVVTRDPEIARRIRLMRLHGISRDAFDRYRSDVPAWHYEVVAPGYKYNLTDPAAALGIVQLGRVRAMADRRAEIARAYDEGLATLDLEIPDGSRDPAAHSWHLYVVRMAPGRDRDSFIRALSGEGVGASVHFIPLHLQPYWRDRYGLDRNDLPRASLAYERVVSLPIYSTMDDGDVERVIVAVAKVLAS